ncbi:MAG: signal recognition particle-docking protein FtsY [Candidatus Micrarchaeaceae archaeon]
MFEELRKKISGVIKSIVKAEELKAGQQPAVPENTEISEPRNGVAKATPAEPIKEASSSNFTKGGAATGLSGHSEHEKNEKLLKISVRSKIKGAFAGTITLSDNEVSDFVDKVKLSFLEADVTYDVAEKIAESLRTNLKSLKVSPSNANAEFVDKVRSSLLEILSGSNKGIDLKSAIEEKINSHAVPVKILFLGPNGTGKTTTIAKIAYLLKNYGISCVISASDTFRAAAIEQTEHHANKVGVPVVKSTYGADPASVAFDAIAHAKSRKIDVVLIDSAGRQETNRNLINEIQKLARIAKPDLTIFVAESTAGGALINQIKEFANVVKLDGIILTKLDCDAKGGNAISIAMETGIPILFLGTGESYASLVKFDPNFIVDNILPKAS